jgi:hypothetical protein
MFYIVNCSGRHVSLASLGVMLAPKQGIDLDSKFPRHQTEKSSDLKNAISRGVVKLVRKDAGPNRIVVEEKNDKINTEMLLQIKKMLEDSRSPDIDAIASAVASKIGSVQVVSNENKDASVRHERDEEINIENDMLDMIHKKAVDRMTKGLEGASSPEQKSTIDVNINRRLDELEGLL